MKIFCLGLIGILLISMITFSFAHPSSDHELIVITNESSYGKGDKIEISVKISEYDGSSIIIQIWKDGHIVYLDQGEITVSGNKEVNYSFTTIAEGQLWTPGTYVVRASHHGSIAETTFTLENLEKDKESTDQTTDSLDTRITIKMEDVRFYLDSPNQIIRASVEIQNYTPSDGVYFMKVTHLPTQKVMKDFEIYPKNVGNDLSAVQIAYPILESDIKFGDQTLFGEFEIHIRTENSSHTASTKFFLFESPPDFSKNKIPDWVKTNAGWWASDNITESEFLQAIKYLIEKEIIKISITENENLLPIIETYFLPSSLSTEHVEITGSFSEKHEGPLTLTIIMPDKSEEKLTTFSRDGSFMTLMALTSESLQGNYQVFAEIKGNQILVSTFNVKDTDSGKVPGWIKNNADWWSQELITDDDFVKGIQYMVEQGIIQV